MGGGSWGKAVHVCIVLSPPIHHDQGVGVLAAHLHIVMAQCELPPPITQ